MQTCAGKHQVCFTDTDFVKQPYVNLNISKVAVSTPKALLAELWAVPTQF